jgi:hypothetical protein
MAASRESLTVAEEEAKSILDSEQAMQENAPLISLVSEKLIPVESSKNHPLYRYEFIVEAKDEQALANTKLKIKEITMAITAGKRHLPDICEKNEVLLITIQKRDGMILGRYINAMEPREEESHASSINQFGEDLREIIRKEKARLAAPKKGMGNKSNSSQQINSRLGEGGFKRKLESELKGDEAFLHHNPTKKPYSSGNGFYLQPGQSVPSFINSEKKSKDKSVLQQSKEADEHVFTIPVASSQRRKAQLNNLLNQLEKEADGSSMSSKLSNKDSEKSKSELENPLNISSPTRAIGN